MAPDHTLALELEVRQFTTRTRNESDLGFRRTLRNADKKGIPVTEQDGCLIVCAAFERSSMRMSYSYATANPFPEAETRSTNEVYASGATAASGGSLPTARNPMSFGWAVALSGAYHYTVLITRTPTAGLDEVDCILASFARSCSILRCSCGL